MAGAALVGGETAEMPGIYDENEYDLAGFAVGLVDKNKIIDGNSIREGDVLIGIASSGIHSNGFSLVRRALRPNENNLNEFIQTLGTTLGEELLKPTKIYVKTILSLMKKINIKGLSHITGGGFIENIPRMLPDGLTARIQCGTWDVLPIFNLLQEVAEIGRLEIYNVFNMGIGMVMAVSPDEAPAALAELLALNEKAYIIGSVMKGREIEICLE